MRRLRLSSRPAGAIVLGGLVSLAASGCSEPDASYLHQVQEAGVLNGEVFLDLARTGSRTGGDPGVRNLRIAFLRLGTSDTVAIATSDTTGAFGVRDVPVGRFTAIPDPSVLGDSLEVTLVDPVDAQVRPLRNTEVSIGLSFRIRSIDEILTGAEGRRLFARGEALNAAGSLPGGALHLREAGRALRVSDAVVTGFEPGDTVLVLGRTVRVANRMTLTQGTGRLVRETLAPPVPVPLSTSQAHTAAGGAAAADFVRVDDAEVLAVSASFGDQILTVNDGSGTLVVRFPGNFLFDLRVTEIEVGEVIDIQGILLRASQGNSWELRPRVATDIMGLVPEG
jgi:hypothetical protein